MFWHHGNVTQLIKMKFLGKKQTKQIHTYIGTEMYKRNAVYSWRCDYEKLEK